MKQNKPRKMKRAKNGNSAANSAASAGSDRSTEQPPDLDGTRSEDEEVTFIVPDSEKLSYEMQSYLNTDGKTPDKDVIQTLFSLIRAQGRELKAVIKQQQATIDELN